MTTPHQYLEAAIEARTPVSIYLVDGEAFPSAIIKSFDRLNMLIEVEGKGDVLVLRGSVKRVAAQTLPLETEVVLQEAH